MGIDHSWTSQFETVKLQIDYQESEPLLLDRNHHYDPHDDLEYARTDLVPIEQYVIL